MDVNLKLLVAKLNDVTRRAMEAAAGLCLSRTHYDIELEHFLLKLLDGPDSDFAHILKHFEVDSSRVVSDLTRALDDLKTGNTRTPVFSPHLARLLTTAWTVGSINYGEANIRSAFAIVSLLSDKDPSRLTHDVSRDLLAIQPEVLRRDLAKIVAGSAEGGTASGDANAGTSAKLASPKNTPNLEQYTVNLVENAKRGMIDRVLGRDSEIRQIVDILMRRRQNNPILTGEAGVGKTAVVEGFALRVANGDVPPALQNVAIHTLDLALLQAGAGVRGEFENRLKKLIAEVKSSPHPIILFIDEAHTMIGAGGQAGQGDAANLLKPALARGELRTIAATTWSEYKKYFEKDAALARRFQVVKVEEPSESQCMVMMRGLVSALEKHHDVRILDEAIAAAVKLSHRYLAGRQLPDKAVSVLDTACARLALGQNSMPGAVEDLIRRIDDIGLQERILRREGAAGTDHRERLNEVIQQKVLLIGDLDRLKEKWEKTKEIVLRIRDIRGQLEAKADVSGNGHAESRADDGHAGPGLAELGTAQVSIAGSRKSAAPAFAPETELPLRSQLNELTVELEAIQGDSTLMQVSVDAHTVGQVVSGWTGIPIGKMVKDEIGLVLELDAHLRRRVIGQDYSLRLIAQRIQTGRANLDDPGKPLGVFLLVGPSGVGKTETAIALSDLLYGGEQNLVTINMSEFQEAHTVSALKGSPPGYVGYGEGGVLTEAVRRRPYSVLLLDEIEKAHPDVRELFYQVFDKGTLEDGEGRQIDFKNTIILLTTNACTDRLTYLSSKSDGLLEPESVVKAIKPELNEIFKPAFLGRMVIVPYYPLADETLKEIAKLKLEKIKRRLFDNHKIRLDWEQNVVDEIIRRCSEVESGARNIDSILTNTLLPDISRRFLTSIAEAQKIEFVSVTIGENGSFRYS